MTIRKATHSDIPRMMEIFAIARRFMAETGNPNQWAETYPSVEQLTDDISRGDSFVCMDEGRIVAAFVLRGGNDPTYDIIYDGAWKNDRPYATIHRIASNGEVKGIFRLAMDYALQHYQTIRIDTHRDNRVMRNALEKFGFEYCGIIHCWNGAERLAYQFG
ncbi:MAG: GNAT family N-acetyltransferase [Bacteroidales bacterium]|nr:GNAT family N-acetyltransferase [Candidatus Liminaster caballi]